MELETKRLILRKPKLSDWKDFVEGLNDIEVSKDLKFEPFPYSKKDALFLLKGFIKNWEKENKEEYTFCIELRQEKKVIGTTGIYAISKHNSKCTTGSWINKRYWRKGYILEAKISVLDFIFNQLKLNKIETAANKENVASNAMSKKLGFKLEGIRRKSVKSQADGRFHDSVLYGLFRGEWKKIRPKILKEVNKKIKKLK